MLVYDKPPIYCTSCKSKLEPIIWHSTHHQGYDPFTGEEKPPFRIHYLKCPRYGEGYSHSEYSVSKGKYYGH